MRILWCVTGAGHFLAECVENFEKLSKKHYVTCVISNAGLEVAKAYGVLSKIKKLSKDVILEKQQGYSTPLSGSQKFDVAIVAPCTANTCAKIVGGVSDSAVSNITSQFLKRRIPVVILPTD